MAEVDPVNLTPRDNLHAHIASLLQELETSDHEFSPLPARNQNDTATPHDEAQYHAAAASPSDQSFEDLLQQFRHLGAALQHDATPTRSVPRPASSSSDIVSLITGMSFDVPDQCAPNCGNHILLLQVSSNGIVVMAVHHLMVTNNIRHPRATRAAR